MKILAFLTEKYSTHDMDENAVDSAFGHVPFYDYMLERIPVENRYNNGMTHFDWAADRFTLDKAWASLYVDYKSFFMN